VPKQAIIKTFLYQLYHIITVLGRFIIKLHHDATRVGLNDYPFPFCEGCSSEEQTKNEERNTHVA
jgi:hypothetical protein